MTSRVISWYAHYAHYACYACVTIVATGCGGQSPPVRTGATGFSRDGVFIEPIAATPAPKTTSTDGDGIVGLSQSIDRQTAQRIARAWVEGVLSQNAQQLRELALDSTASGPTDRESLVKQWLARGRYQRGRTRDEAFDPETVKILEHDPEAAQHGAVAVTFEVKFDGAPMARSYMPRPALSVVRLLLVQGADGSPRIAASRE